MSGFCGGSNGAGALTQLIAQGAIDQYLSQGASFTFWKVKYNKHTPFALESISQPFNTSVSFGTESQVTLNRNGDLVYFQYIVISLPGITACQAASDCSGIQGAGQFPYWGQPCNPCGEADKAVYEDYLSDGYSEASCDTKKEKMRNAKNRWNRDKYGACVSLECCEENDDDCPTNVCGEDIYCHWTNDVGQFIVKCARIVIGGSVIDQLWNDLLFMWEELSGRSGRRLIEMTGKAYSRTQLVCESRSARILYCPMPWWFTQHSGQALALASLQFHGVQLHVEWERLEKCIVVSGPGVVVKNCSTACCITSNDLSACVESTFVFLDVAERDRFATTQYEVLIVQHQCFHQSFCQSQIRVSLAFNHPIIELIWAVRRHCHEKCNSWYNFSGIDQKDPIVSAALHLNNQARFSNKSAAYFRMVVPYQAHMNIPDCHIYNYSFALHPEDPSPSGSCNFSRIDHVDMVFQLQEGLGKEQVTLLIFARNWNILRFRDGLAGLAYAN
tara:strand:+ start:1358 stop:2860 length:1503 start_codon:yes stop_codon:yes gene_type:complete